MFSLDFIYFLMASSNVKSVCSMRSLFSENSAAIASALRFPARVGSFEVND